MRSHFSLLAAVAAVAVSAQTQNYTSSLDMTIDANSVDPAERVSWCNAQYNTCDALCDDDSSKNDCVDTTLAYDCECASNKSAPGLQYYTQTMPTFICQKLYEVCISNADGTKKATDACVENIQDYCGTAKPPTVKKNNDDEDDDDDSSDNSSESATTTADSSESTETESEESVTTTTSDGFAAPTMAPAGKGAAAAVAIGMLAYLV